MNAGSNWAILVAVRHGDEPRTAARDELRMREMQQLAARAAALTNPATTFALVKREFVEEWKTTVTELPQRNLFIHPVDAAPLAGITRVLQTILARDAKARVILIPADHCAAMESAWIKSAKGALALIEERDDRVYLLHDQTRAEQHFSQPSEEMCSTTVIVGSAESLMHLGEGRRETKVLDLMTEHEAEAKESASTPPLEVQDRPLNLIHVRLVEEYERIQAGSAWRAASRVHVTA